MSVRAYAFYETPSIPQSYEAVGNLRLPVFGREPQVIVQPRNEFFAVCTVRIHEKWTQHGDLKGTNFHYAETEEVTPKLILWASEWAQFVADGMPFRNLIFSIEPGLAYQVDSDLPADDQTITLNVFRLDPRKAASLPYPEQ